MSASRLFKNYWSQSLWLLGRLLVPISNDGVYTGLSVYCALCNSGINTHKWETFPQGVPGQRDLVLLWACNSPPSTGYQLPTWYRLHVGVCICWVKHK